MASSFMTERRSPKRQASFECPMAAQTLRALQDIVQVASRAHFQLALSENSLREVERKGDAGHLN
jgi:hypothetical protein